MGVMELVGVDLMELRGKSYVVIGDKKTGFRFFVQLQRTATRDVTSALEHWFFM